MTRGRRTFGIVVFAGAVACAAAAGAPARAETPIPAAPSTFVTDNAALLSPEAAATLEARLADFDRRTGHQVIVWTDRTTGGAPVEDWAARAFAKWRVGRKGVDDGVALFVFTDDRRVRIEVGYGLEATLPDARAARILDEAVVPRLRAGRGGEAVTGGVDAILATLGGGADGAPGPLPPPVPFWVVVMGGFALFVLVIFLARHPALAAWLLISMARGGGGGRRGGGLGGGFGGGGFSGGGGRSGGGGASRSW
jgi:uncharacterized protein